jgi:dephospho-CoA kinase
MIIGITGYIGVGKSTAAEILSKQNIISKQGFKIIDVDKLGHELLQNGEVKNNLIGEFGEKILGRDLNIDRKKLGELVFSNTELLQKLNGIVHSRLREKLKEIIRDIKAKNENAIIDVALLTELKINYLCDKIILIKADTEKVYDRMVKGYNKKQILNVMNSQKVQKYDYVVENNGNKEDLKENLINLEIKKNLH